MTLPTNINLLEKSKFEEVGGQVCVRVTGTVNATVTAASGGATEAKQDQQIVLETAMAASLSSIDAGIPAALGQATMANSIPVAVASNQSAIPISAASLPLPTGAATEATLAAIDAGIPAALGQTTMSASMPVVIASNQTAVPISAAALPLPSGAATETTLASIDAGVPAALGQTTMSASMPVAIASNQSAFPVNTIAGQTGVQGGSGTTNALTQRVVLATDVALPAGTNTIGNVKLAAATSGGATTFSLISTGSSGDANNIKSSAGQLIGWSFSNINASPAYVKVYNSASAPTAGSGTPVLRLIIPGSSTGAGSNIFGDLGLAFSSGIGFTIVTGATDAASTGVAANEVLVNFFYA